MPSKTKKLNIFDEAGSKVFLLRSLYFCFIVQILVKKSYFGLNALLCSHIALHTRFKSADNGFLIVIITHISFDILP